jgi:hypothetical protein
MNLVRAISNIAIKGENLPMPNGQPLSKYILFQSDGRAAAKNNYSFFNPQCVYCSPFTRRCEP